MEEVEMRQCLEAKFMDAHENLCDSVDDLQLVLAVTVFGKEGCERDKSTQNVVNNKRNMVERDMSKFDDSNFATPLSTTLLSLFTTFCIL